MSSVITLIIAFCAAVLGSINGLGVTLIISTYLLMLDFDKIHSHLWLPYLSTGIVASVFLLLRPRLWFNNLIPILQMTFCCALGLIAGKILNKQLDLIAIKIAIGVLISFITFLIWKLDYISLLGKEIFLEHDWNITFIDSIIFVLTGFLAGTFEFSLAAFLYAYLILRQKHYQVETLDVSVYSVLIVTSIINLVSSLISYNGKIPESIDALFFVVIISGAILGKFIYKYISIELRKKIIFGSLVFLGAKLILQNLWLIIFSNN